MSKRWYDIIFAKLAFDVMRDAAISRPIWVTFISWPSVFSAILASAIATSIKAKGIPPMTSDVSYVTTTAPRLLTATRKDRVLDYMGFCWPTTTSTTSVIFSCHNRLSTNTIRSSPASWITMRIISFNRMPWELGLTTKRYLIIIVLVPSHI